MSVCGCSVCRSAETQKARAKTKVVRQRGSEAPNHAAVLQYLKQLEAEVETVRCHLDVAWADLDAKPGKDFCKCSRHMDAAQQRLHRVIKKISKRVS